MLTAGEQRRARSRGHSLLEVLTAMTILGTVMAIGLPNMVNLRKPHKVMGAARQIAADVQVARQRAIARNARYRINFNTTAKTWTLERETAPSSNSWTADGSAQPLPSGAAFGTITGASSVFNSRGMLSAAVSVPVTMSGATTRRVNVNVLGKTSIS